MSIQIDRITGPLIVAGILALVGFAWKISAQVESIQSEVKANRTVTCTFARKLEVIVAGCEQRP